MASRLVRCSSVTVLLVASLSSVWAGPTGLTVIPTADVLAPATGSLEFEAVGRQVAFGGDCDRAVLFEIGLSQGIEAGIDTSISSSEGPWLNAKWLVRDETALLPAVAVGLQNVGEDVVAEPYLVLAKDVGKVRVHIGGVRTGHRIYGMLGAEVPAGPQLTACADYVSGHAGTASVGLSWEISDTVSVAAARIFANDSEEEDNWYFNLGYTLVSSQ